MAKPDAIIFCMYMHLFNMNDSFAAFVHDEDDDDDERTSFWYNGWW